MKIYGLTEQELRSAVDMANDTDECQGNLRFNREPEQFSKRNLGFNLTLRVKDSKGPGAKEGYSGRRTVSANYYAHYAFMEAIFAINEDARILTAMETYNGKDEFREKAGAVAYRNVGSMMYPRAYGDM